MADDPVPGRGVPEPVREWLDGVAEDGDVTRADLLARLLDGEDDVELAARVESLEGAVEEIEDELAEKVQDVRDRVIQVKREADTKAPADHGHPGLATDVDRVDELLDVLGQDFAELESAVDDLGGRLDDLDRRTSAGFSNFREVLEYLLETTDQLTENVATLAAAARELRGRTDRVTERSARAGAVERLASDAHEHGVTTADCGACGGTVHLGMLFAPECPHCSAHFTGVEPRRGFFRSNVLHTGEQPALEGPVGGDGSDLESLVDGMESTPPSVAVEPGDDDGEPEEVTAGTGEAAHDDRPLDTLTGIGPAYAERLRDAGVESVADLALADAERLARETDIAPGRVRNLVERARDAVEFG